MAFISAAGSGWVSSLTPCSLGRAVVFADRLNIVPGNPIARPAGRDEGNI
jgi:hypothetical protein